jgi:hypothetical protein
MLLSLLYRSAPQDFRAAVSHFSLVAVGLHPRLLLDCSNVTQSNVTTALTCLAAYMLELPALVDAPQPQPPRAISDLDSIMATCVALAQSRSYKPGVIMVSECNISSSASQVCAKFADFPHDPWSSRCAPAHVRMRNSARSGRLLLQRHQACVSRPHIPAWMHPRC